MEGLWVKTGSTNPIPPALVIYHIICFIVILKARNTFLIILVLNLRGFPKSNIDPVMKRSVHHILIYFSFDLLSFFTNKFFLS